MERRWNSDTLWLLSRDVESVLEQIGGPRKPRYYNTPSQVRDSRVREWIERNGRTDWLPFRGFPTSGDLELDKTVAMAEELIHYMIAEVMRLGTTYQQFAARLGELPTRERDEADAPSRANELPRRNFVIAAHDFWPNTFAENVCLAIEAVKNHTDEGQPTAASQLGGAIQAGFERPPRTERTRITLEQEFLDLINLPIWKKRHELYAVWVSSRIADALSESGIQTGTHCAFPFREWNLPQSARKIPSTRLCLKANHFGKLALEAMPATRRQMTIAS